MIKILKKEDSLALLIAFALIAFISLAYASNAEIYAFFGFKIKSYTHLNELLSGLNTNLGLLYVAFTSIFSLVAYILGKGVKKSILHFTLFFALCLFVFALGSYSGVKSWAESPLIALLLGLILANFTKIKLKNALQTELYIKIGIVLMGVSLPLNAFLQAANVAIIQACVVAINTFLVIFFIASRLFNLDKKFAATLAAGGSICGVSAAIIVGEACKAKKEHISASISIVVFFATLMIIILPIFCKALGLDSAVAGAFIGTSEFADAAGFAAVASLGDERATLAFSLMKVIGRDAFIGVWAVLIAIISLKFWDKKQGEKVSPIIIWQKFPKFILGFVLACLFASLIALCLDEQAFKTFQKDALSVLKNLKNWFFTFAFLSIGLSVRFRDILSVGFKPFLAFFLGACVNLILGFTLCVFVFDEFWVNFLKGVNFE